MPKEGTGPRLVYRDPGWRSTTAAYRTIRMSELRFIPKHVETSHAFDGQKFTPQKRQRPDAIRVFTPGSMRDIAPPERIGDYVRRPTAKALARIEAAEQAIRDAQAELKAARRAAFTYGKTVPVSTVKRQKAAPPPEDAVAIDR